MIMAPQTDSKFLLFYFLHKHIVKKTTSIEGSALRILFNHIELGFLCPVLWLGIISGKICRISGIRQEKTRSDPTLVLSCPAKGQFSLFNKCRRLRSVDEAEDDLAEEGEDEEDDLEEGNDGDAHHQAQAATDVGHKVQHTLENYHSDMEQKCPSKVLSFSFMFSLFYFSLTEN